MEEREWKEYIALLSRVSTTARGKESRTLHRELKKFGDGLSLSKRYPIIDHIPLICSLLAIFITILGWFI